MRHLSIILLMTGLASAAHGQNQPELVAIDLVVLAKQQLTIRDSNGNAVLEPPIYEVRRLLPARWYSTDGPQLVDLVLLLENTTSVDIVDVEVQLYAKRKITTLRHPRDEFSQDSVAVLAPRRIDAIAKDSVAAVTFENIPMEVLYSGLWEQGLWPAEVSFEPIITCACTSKSTSASIELVARD